VATFIQWNRNRSVRRVTWVCGPEPALVREVVAAHQDGSPPDQCVTLFAGEVPEREIWDVVLSDPASGGRRAAVHGAERLKNLANVAQAAGPDAADSAFAVFVSAASDFEREDGALVPHLAALQASRAGQLIRCCEPSSLEDRVALVASWWPGATPTVAHEVLSCSGSLSAAWLACEQARLAGLAPSPQLAAAVCRPEPGGELADLLMAGDKRRAMAVAARGDLAPAIGLLASRLATAELIGDGMRAGLAPREAVAEKRIDRFAASRVLPHLAAYGPDRIQACRSILAGAETAWRSGARLGVAESLIALW
jgi:hypothetical protein